MFTKPGVLLRVEGAAGFAVALYLYRYIGAGWGCFLLLFLWPDIFMLGYLANVRLGTALYNLVHIVAFPVLLAVGSFAPCPARIFTSVRFLLAHVSGVR